MQPVKIQPFDTSRANNQLILILLFSLFFCSTSSHAANQTILTKPEKWLSTLSQEDQRIALLRYQSGLIEKSENVRTQAKNAKDRLWSTKILFCGHLLASDLATKNKDQQEAITLMTQALGDVISGKGTIENRKSKLEKAELSNRKIADSISNIAADSFQRKHTFDSDEINKSLIVAAMLCASTDSGKNEPSICTPKGTDVCKIARRMANEIAPQLPMQLSSQLSLQTVTAVNNYFLMTAKLEYGSTHLQKALSKSGASNEEMLEIMHRHAKSGICQPGTPTHSFINSGGFINYQYRFNDGEIYTQIEVTTCQ